MGKTLQDILDVASTYIKNEESLLIIKNAHDIAVKMHEGQFRKSGDPYVQHPIEVAYILTNLHTGPNTIAAALVHDVLEDTEMSKEQMEELLGKDVVSIVDGVTKISKLKYMTADKALAKDHQKILLAMANDMRVILVKIADRLHNMRTLEFHSNKEKQIKIAKETIELYAPLAHKLGMYRIKAELEDLSLKFISNEEYVKIASSIKEKKSEREEDISIMSDKINELLKTHGVKNYELKGRIKNIYSIYKKIVSKGKTMDEIYDLLALRIIVNSIEDCYRVLGIVHGEWTPLPMRFKDYIAVPKSNMYQSLHTTIVGLGGKIFEIQIRTYEMDEIAELGVAAHWAYKEGTNYNPESQQLEIINKLKWYKDLTTYVEMSGNNDPVSNLAEDLFSTNVYVFTPKGQVIDLPSGSMPLDFAYRIHTHVGEKTVGAIVNGKIVPLNYKLKTADVVEIKTNKNSAGPTKEWLKNAKTSHARHKIKSFINKKHRDEQIEKGRMELEKAIKSFEVPVPVIDDKVVVEYFSKNNIKNLEELHYEIGKANFSALMVLNRICGLSDAKLDDETALKQYSEDSVKRRRQVTNCNGIIVEGLDRAQVKLANCCQPVHGDVVYGYVVKTKGIVVHREGCPNISKDDSDRAIEVKWDPEFKGCYFDTTLKITSFDKRNSVAEMINIINATPTTISSVTSTKNSANECVTKFKLQVSNLEDLNHVIVALGNLSEILKIERIIK
jgi:GTP pyrophosphokinase